MAGNKSVILSLLGNNRKAKEAITETQADIDKLKESSSEVVLGASTGEADAKITALDDALAKYKVAADEAEAAQARLAEVQGGEGGSSAEVLSKAENEAAAATERLAAAQRSLGDAELASGEKTVAASAKQEESAAKTTAAGDAAEGSKAKWGLLALGAVAAGGVMVAAAAKFQDATTHLVTDAGESQKNLGMVQQGILSVSAATGTSADDINNAMYHIESGGFHGASGLALLKTAAEGAKVGGADLDTVSRVLVGTMNAYGMSSKNGATQTKMANTMMNEMIATVGAGDMKMQDLASSMSAVAPLAAAVGIKFSQVGGAIATMTAQGMSAQQSTQDLANTIRALSNPNNVAIKEMGQLGINAQDVSKNLSKQGLTGTISMLSETVLKQMGPSGEVMLKAFTQSQTAGSDLQIMLKSMPSSVAALANSYMKGSMTQAQWTAAMKAQDPVNAHLMSQFGTLYNNAHSFNSILSAGGPASQTYTAAMAKMMGGATGLNTALMLTGKNSTVFANNATTIQGAADKTGSSVNNWTTIQHTLSFQLEQAKTSVEDLGISVGMKLLPPVMAIIGPTAHFLSLLVSLPGAGPVIAGLAIGFLALWAAVKVGGSIKEVFKGVEGALGAVKSALIETATADGEAATAQEGLNLAWLASPITWIVIAIVGLVVVIYELSKHSAAFRDFWKTAWHDILAVIDGVFGWVKHNWPLLLGILVGPIGIAVIEIIKHWNSIWSGARMALNNVISFFRGLPGDILRAVGNLGNLLLSAGENIIQGLINGVENQAAGLLNMVSSLGSKISGAFKSVMGIFSPSRVFADHGKNIVLGLVSGIEGNSHLGESAVTRMAQKAINASQGRFPGSGGSGSGALQIEWVGGGGADQEFITWLKKQIRIRGGDPGVLGR